VALARFGLKVGESQTVPKAQIPVSEIHDRNVISTLPQSNLTLSPRKYSK